MQPSRVRSRKGYKLVHPGVILWENWMCPFGISQNALARHMGVSPRRINAIVLGKRAITADTALGLAEAFGGEPHFWMALQADYDIEIAQMKQDTRPPRNKRPFRVLGECLPVDVVHWHMHPDPLHGYGAPRHEGGNRNEDDQVSYDAMRSYGASRHER